VKRRARKKHFLVGKFFHTFVDGKLSWQGVVTAEPAPGYFLVRLFEWLCGHPSDEELVPIAQMVGWKFYDSAEDWRDAATIIGQLEERTSTTVKDKKEKQNMDSKKQLLHKYELLLEIRKDYKHLIETFHLGNVLNVIESIELTEDRQTDIKTFLRKLELSHAAAEFSAAEESGDSFKAAAKKLVDSHGANATIEHVNEALANL
jgi:hypothetical protein